MTMCESTTFRALNSLPFWICSFCRLTSNQCCGAMDPGCIGLRRWRIISLFIGWLVFALNFVAFIFLIVLMNKNSVGTALELLYTSTFCSKFVAHSHWMYRVLTIWINQFLVVRLLNVSAFLLRWNCHTWIFFYSIAVIIFSVNLSWLYGATFVSINWSILKRSIDWIQRFCGGFWSFSSKMCVDIA